MAIAASPVEIEGDAIAVTASFGVAQSRGDLESSDAAIGRADTGLYQAKEAGRNRVVGIA